jgi:hypothetical protein
MKSKDAKNMKPAMSDLPSNVWSGTNDIISLCNNPDSVIIAATDERRNSMHLICAAG